MQLRSPVAFRILGSRERNPLASIPVSCFVETLMQVR